MIRKVLLSTAALVAISGTAFAADLPSRRAPPVYVPPPIPIFSWTGFYIGGDIGYAFGRDRAQLTRLNGAALPGIVGQQFNVGQSNGLIGGGHIGYNLSTQSFPLLGGFGGSGGVIGVEADITGSDYRGNLGTVPGAAGALFSPIIHSTSQVQGSVRARVGIAVDRALFFATGGAAVAEFENRYLNILAISHDRIGWTVGGGVEYALTTNWSLRAEYRYSDFGKFQDSIPVTATLVGVQHRNTMNRATVGFSYKFDTPVVAPVVARY